MLPSPVIHPSCRPFRLDSFPHFSGFNLHSIAISITTSPTVLLVFLERASRQCSMFLKANSRKQHFYNVCNQDQPTRARQSQSFQSLQDTNSSLGMLSFLDPSSTLIRQSRERSVLKERKVLYLAPRTILVESNHGPANGL